MADFSHQCSRSGALARLRLITLTIHQQTPLDLWTRDVTSLLSASPLEVFQVYSLGAVLEASMTNEFWSGIVTAHEARLTRISVHRMLVSMDAIEDICRRCTALEQLFIVVEQDAFVSGAKGS